jgi:hypothetical protein
LSGSIPSSIGNLINLSFLSLTNNQLSGSIPLSVGKLVNLGGMELSSNKLSGSIPASIGNLSNLYELLLSNNQLSGSIPSSIGNPVNLVFLYLNNNQLSGTIPSELGNLINLSFLNLSHNKLSGKIPAGLANLPQSLYTFDLSYNLFTYNGMQLVAQSQPFAIYNHQALIPVHQNGNTLSVSAGGTLKNNTYKWFKVGQAGNTTIKGDSVFHPSENGRYFTTVTNSVATQLTLKSDTIKYTAPATLSTPAIASSENIIQQQDKKNLFLVYPNPAKNILHVQTSGKVILALTDQSGKILLTKTIEGNGVINVTQLTGGIYYLKNNTTGAVHKVIVSK